jgi:hydrogenase expression/formation protein HypD
MRPWVLMEICGGQTHTLMRYGIDELIPKQVELVHGPGCPVCVTPLEIVDQAIEIAACPTRDLRLLRRHAARARLVFRPVPVKAQGGDVRIAYTPMDALKIARANPERQGGVLRHRFRNHRAGQRHGGLAGQRARA